MNDLKEEEGEGDKIGRLGMEGGRGLIGPYHCITL